MVLRASFWFAWSLFGVTVALLIAMLLLSSEQEPAYDTLLYSLLPISLALVYFGPVLSLRYVSRALTGSAEQVSLWLRPSDHVVKR
jgi:hypothetical protein